jgi:hypothetical protein
MEWQILLWGGTFALGWWLAWTTSAQMHRRRQHLYSRRLIEAERRARRQAALAHDLYRLRG